MKKKFSILCAFLALSLAAFTACNKAKGTIFNGEGVVENEIPGLFFGQFGKTQVIEPEAMIEFTSSKEAIIHVRLKGQEDGIQIMYKGKVSKDEGSLKFQSRYIANAEILAEISEMMVELHQRGYLHKGDLWVEGEPMTKIADGCWFGQTHIFFRCIGFNEKEKDRFERSYCPKGRVEELSLFKITLTSLQEYVSE